MPGKFSNSDPNIFYMSVGAECLRIPGACGNQNSFLNSINPSGRRMISQGTKKGRIANLLLNFFNIHQSGFNYATKTGEKILAIITR